jgi:hypothetical protein
MSVEGEVLSIETVTLPSLTARQSQLREGGTADDLMESLHERHPDMPNDAQVDVVSFRLHLRRADQRHS